MINTRIAPSPTGEAHVGTAYVALFNQMAARRSGGKFTLRIEDTDTKRTVAGAEERLCEAMEWLGLSPDYGPRQGGPEGPYRQSERLEKYRKVAWQLVEAGIAYPAFETAEELEEIRRLMQEQKEHIIKLPSRELSVEEAKKRAQKEAHVIRLKAPRTGQITIKDLIRGEVTFACEEIDDKVLIKQDGGATYHMAATYDDRVMGINLVIRAEEWLTSTPVHVMLHQSMAKLGIGTGIPEFAHLPLLRSPGGKKISKRKNPTSIDWYRREGILPESLLEFLATMGWGGAHGKTLKEMQSVFDVKDISPGAPVFDLQRLKTHNAARLHALNNSSLQKALDEWGKHCQEDTSNNLSDLSIVARRSQTLKELSSLIKQVEQGHKVKIPKGSWQEKVNQVAIQALREGKEESDIINSIRQCANEKGISLKEACNHLRLQLWGDTQGPGISELGQLLGAKAIERLGG